MTVDPDLANIIVVDDDYYVIEAYKRILGTSEDYDESIEIENELNDLRNDILGEESSKSSKSKQKFNLTTCSGGKEAVIKVKDAKDDGRPFSVAFVDVVMPPGPDGIWTAQKIRLLDKDINIVIVTAHSDKSVDEIAKVVKPADKLFYLKKPFHASEIRQFAIGLSAKWSSEQQLKEMIDQRNKDLAHANIALNEELENHDKTQENLEKSQVQLRRKSDEIDGMTTAMESIFGRRINAKKETEESIVANVKNLIEPNIEKLRNTRLDPIQERLINLLEADLLTIVSPFMKNQTFSMYRFTINEVNVAKLIIRGNSSKEICDLLNLSKRTIDYYREKMRKKLGIHNSNVSLKERLYELDKG